METTEKISITVESIVNAPVAKVWEYWNKPEHITEWCQASDDWHAPYAENDLKVGGKFKTTMAAKDGSFSFDFGGVYSKVEQHKAIEYKMDDGREVRIKFTEAGNGTAIAETFDAENTNPAEMQRAGWQAILDNFARYTEKNEADITRYQEPDASSALTVLNLIFYKPDTFSLAKFTSDLFIKFNSQLLCLVKVCTGFRIFLQL